MSNAMLLAIELAAKGYTRKQIKRIIKTIL